MLPGLELLALAARDAGGRVLGPGDIERRCVRPQHVVEPAVIVALELDDDLAARGRAGEAERSLHDLRARGGEAHALGAGHHRADPARRLGLDVGLAGIEDAALHLRLGCGDHARRVVAEDHRPHA